MSLSGKSTTSLRKTDLLSQKEPALSFKKLAFAHKATAGDTSINLSSLSLPSELADWNQPTLSELQSLSVVQLKKNMLLVSSARGPLMYGLSYTIGGSGAINFTSDFGPALDQEIFIGTLDSIPRTGTLVADIDFICETGTLAANSTDITLGKSFKTNANPSKQLGNVMVFVDGQPLMRNVGNATAAPSADGNYQEVDSGNGYSVLIRLNDTSASSRPYTVVSTAGSVIRPDGSLMDEIEKIQATQDLLVAYMADVADVPTTTFQAAPTQVQLRQFGDAVVGLSQPGSLGTPRLATSSVAGALKKPDTMIRLQNAAGHGSTDNKIRRIETSLESVGSGVTVAHSASNGTTVTINEDGIYEIMYIDGHSSVANFGITKNATGGELTTAISGLLGSAKILTITSNPASASGISCCSATVRLVAGDVLRPHTDGTTSFGAYAHLTVTQVMKL